MTPAILAIAPSDLDLERLLAALSLANTRKTWTDLARRAEAENWSYRDFLAIVCAEEMSHRRQTRMQKDTRHAGFPFLKTIEDFDFTLQSSLRLALLGSYLGPELVSEGRNLILQGKTGRGKTHLAIAIGYRAIQNGFTVRFVTAAELIDDLSDASRDGKLMAALASYTQPHVLIIDEVGYLTYGNDAANILFHVVNDRHIRKRPILFTTNKSPLTHWGDVLHDRDLADAIVDRTLERGRLILMDGPSSRTRHLDLDAAARAGDVAEPARVSGTASAEFQEPAFDTMAPAGNRGAAPPSAAPRRAARRRHRPSNPQNSRPGRCRSRRARARRALSGA